MSFTQDEIQAFNDILEKKLAANRREMERVLEQRFHNVRREFEQRLNTVQQELVQTLAQKLGDQQRGLQSTLNQKLSAQQISISQAVSQEVRQRLQQQQPQFEGLIDRALAAQLLAIEELLNQRLSIQSADDAIMTEGIDDHDQGDQTQHFDTIEVQTDVTWEDLLDIFGKALDERFMALNDATQSSMHNLEQYFSAQLRTMQSHFQEIVLRNRQSQAYTGNLTNLQEVFQSIEQLERIIESMQVAMTANHAMLSNRLYHHQQLSMERAHSNNNAASSVAPPARLAHPNTTNIDNPSSLNGERSGK